MRHGQSSFNAEKRIQGHIDESTLTPDGIAQAGKVGAALQGMAFDSVFSSPLQRAQKTAEVIVELLRVTHPDTPAPQLSEDLKEINLPLWEGVSFTDAEAKWPEEYRAWREDPENFYMQVPTATGIEVFYPVRSLYEQAARFWQTLLADHAGETILLVAHSAINRALLSTAIGLPIERFNSLQQSNCGVSVLNFMGKFGQPVQFESINLTSHMDEPIPHRRAGHRGPRFLLVRHGETEWNRQGRFQGQIDVPLNENGHAQAAKAAEFLKAIPIHGAVSSPMLRPKETAEAILKHHPDVVLELMDDLKEISHGEWEGKFESEIEAGYPGMLQQWQQSPETVQMPAGENLQQVWQRSLAAWKQIVLTYSQSDAPQTVLVVAHDAVNKALLCQILGLGPEYFWAFKQGNGGVSVIDYAQDSDSLPVLTALNITTHLSAGILDKTAAGAL